MNNLKKKISKLPLEPGIYKFFDREGNLLYVGKSVSIKKRVSSYFSTKNLGPKTNQLVSRITDIDYLKVFSEFEALLLESELIRKYKPFYNIIARDDKSPIYIRITNTQVPLVEVTRKPQNFEKDFVKGPFPSTKTTKEILKYIRRIFPYCHHKNPKKPCLFVHLGLCPYPYASAQTRQNYKENIKNIKSLLNGKSKLLTKRLIREMNDHSKNQRYEKAGLVKEQLQKLEYIQSIHHQPKDFLERPTLVDDLTEARLKDLKKILNLPKNPRRIECYDISNISGKFATGSMVVFENGKAQKSEYRKFKIKMLSTPNDYEMIRQVLTRRFKNNWAQPDLIIIDGGKGQLKVAAETLALFNKNISIISLAKRLEEIYLPNSKNPISLPKESLARQLAQAARDEAHRFAITYHRHLRSKDFIK
jgi:excinuclease ABC subunit C